jgi:glycine betaine/proline transport system ATP-binding protein
VGTGAEILSAPADDYVSAFIADVDRARVLKAEDVMRETSLVATPDEGPADLLDRLGRHEANAAYVLDRSGRVLGVAGDDLLADAVKRGDSRLSPGCLADEYLTTTPDKPLIELCSLVGRRLVPLGVVDSEQHLIGMVPRATLLSAMASSPGKQRHA